MKTLIFIAILSLFTTTHAQYNKKDAYIVASILGTTFATLEVKGHQMTYGQRRVTAITGIILSAGYSLYKTTAVGKRIQRRIKLRRNR